MSRYDEYVKTINTTRIIEIEQLRLLFDIAVGSMDFGSGFLDHEEVLVLREFAEILGVDPFEATPDNFKASFAHDFIGKPGVIYTWGKEILRTEKVPAELCVVCNRLEKNPAHHGVSVAEQTDHYEMSYEERGQRDHGYEGPGHCYPCDQIARYRAVFGVIDEPFVEMDQQLEPKLRERSVMDLNRVPLTEEYQAYLRSDERFAMWQAEARGQLAPQYKEVS